MMIALMWNNLYIEAIKMALVKLIHEIVLLPFQPSSLQTPFNPDFS